jgi:broad specificity phosphatase PhoE
MATLFLIRHARPAAVWGGQDTDPGLDDVGHQQAAAAAQALSSLSSPVPIYSSPLRRCRETAAPLEALWRQNSEVITAVAEIPSPPLPAAERREWLTKGMAGTWTELERTAPAGAPDYRQWRSALIRRLADFPENAAIFTHFIAINVAVGVAQGSDAVVCFRPDHASVTKIEVSPTGSVRLLELGREAQTTVLTRG